MAPTFHPPLAHVLDLTANLGSHALQQLGERVPDEPGYWCNLALAPHPLAHRVNWHRPGAGALRAPDVQAGLLIVLIGPGAYSRLDSLVPLVNAFAGPVALFVTPSAIVEEINLKTRRSSLRAGIEIHRLPTSDPTSVWLVLLEQITQTPAPNAGSDLTLTHGAPDMPSNLKQSIDVAMTINGAMAVALVDYNSGLCLAQAGGGMNLDLAAAGNTDVVRAKLKTVESLGLRSSIEDILITLGDQYHLIRLIPTHPGLFLYLVLDKSKGNLALARYKLMDIEHGLKV